MRARILCLQRDCEPNERKKGEKERDARDTCVRLCACREKRLTKRRRPAGRRFARNERSLGPRNQAGITSTKRLQP